MDRFVTLKHPPPRPVEQRLGFGTYGTVFLRNGVAVKLFNQDNVISGVLADAIKEIAVLKALSHPNIVKFVRLEPEPGTDMPGMAVEYVPMGSLDMFHVRMSRMGYMCNMRVYSGILLGLFDGLRYLHSLGIVHRDIKPQNVLYCAHEMTVKIADFGSAALHRPSTELPGDRHTDWVTTLPYRAPEALMGLDKILGTEMDVWSAGVLVYELLTNRTFISHRHESNEEALENILFLMGTPTVENSAMPSYFAQRNTRKPPAPKDGSSSVLHTPSFSFDVLEYYAGGKVHKWGFDIKCLIRILKSTVKLEPSARMTADEVYSVLVPNSAIAHDPDFLNDRQKYYENAVANVMEDANRGCVEMVGDMAELRESLKTWIFEANVMTRNIHTRRNFHVAAAIWDQLLSRKFPEIEAADSMAAAMAAVYMISSKVCDTSPLVMGTYLDAYKMHRAHIIRTSGCWAGRNDDMLTNAQVEKMEMIILNRIGWQSWRILPVDIEAEPEFLSVVTKPYIYRYFIDVAVSIGCNIHIGVNVKKILEAAAWLEGVVSLQCSPRTFLEDDVKYIVIGILRSILDGNSSIYNFYNKDIYENASSEAAKYDLEKLIITINTS